MELRAKVYGQVHRVGFRATTVEFAHELHLKGFVRNCSDGTVEIVAQGEKQALEELLAKLQSVFTINKIDHQYVKPTEIYSNFSSR